MRKVFGFAAILLGMIGILACAAGVAGIWLVRARAAQAGQTTLTAIDDALSAGGEHLARAQTGVKSVHDVAAPAAQAITKLAEAKADIKIDDDKELLRIQSELSRRIDQMEGYVDLGRIAADILERAIKAARAAEMPALDRHLDSLEHARAVGAQIVEVMGQLRSLFAALVEIRASRRVRAELIARGAAAAASIEAKLRGVQDRLSTLQGELTTVRSELNSVSGALPRWLLWGALALTVLLAWLGLGQLTLFLSGLRAMRSRPAAA